MRVWTFGAAGAALLFLSACDGGGGGAPAPGFAGLDADFAALDARLSALPLADPGGLPAAGGASFEGVMRLSSDGGGGVPADLAGTMTLTADFGASRVQGTADGFVDGSDAALAGSLALGTGVIDRDADLSSGYTFDLAVRGTLTTAGGTAIAVDADGAGDFVGPDVDGVLGLVAGTATTGAGRAGLAGEFAAER